MSVGNIVYDLNWYQLPIKDQFIVHTIIRRSHDPVELKGLGVFVCSLETFLEVNITKNALLYAVNYQLNTFFFFCSGGIQLIRRGLSIYILFRQLSTKFIKSHRL